MSVRIINGYLHLDFRFHERRYRSTTKLLPTPENLKFCSQWAAAIDREIALGIFDRARHFPKYAGEEGIAQPQRTFRQDAEAWLEIHKETWGEWTYRKFKNNLQNRIFDKPFASLITTDIKPRDLRQLLAAIVKEGRRDGTKLSNRSVNKIMQPVKEILLEMFADGDLLSNPIPRRLKLKERRLEDIRPFTDDELRQLFAAARRPEFIHYEPLVNFIFESGFRPEETYGMLWANTDLDSLTIHIQEVRALGKQKIPKTEYAQRDVEITSGMEKWLRAQKSRSFLRSPFVWLTTRGKPIDTSSFAKDIFKPLCETAGVDYRPPKQARHTWATRHISRGTDPRWMSKQMGTSLEMIFKTYTAVFDRAREGNAAQLIKWRGHVLGTRRK